jgi:RHS repeat-associated protein
MHTDTLQFIGHEEGRVRWAYHNYSNVPIGYKDTIAYKFEYDFFERDHLGNTRTVLTQQRDTSNYIVTMEAAYRSTELQLFGNVAATSTAWTSMPNYTNILSGTRYLYTNPNDSVSKVDSTSAGGQKVGPNLLLKVMSGDTVNFTVQCYYVSPGGGSTNNSSFSDVLNSLSNGLVNLTGGAHGNLLNLTGSGSTVYNGLSSFLSGDDTAHTGYPKAYLNWIFLDDQFNYDSSLSGSVLAASSNNPPGSMNPVAPGGSITLNKSGYLYIWVSNETTGWDVYFDNLSIQYKQGPLLEENHYYPFGLTMAGISDKAIKTNYAENKYRYNGEELQHQEFSDGSGLEEYDYGARFQDPQLGIWHCIDPLAENTANMSPYCYGNNNPIGSIDLGGLITVAPPHNYVGPPTSYNEILYTPWGDPYLSSAAFNYNFMNLAGSAGGDASSQAQQSASSQAEQDAIFYAEYAQVQSHTARLFPEFAYLDIPGVTDASVTTNDFGVQVIRIQWNTIENGVPVVHSLTQPQLNNLNVGGPGWGNSGILSWRSFNFQPMGTSSKLYEAGVMDLTWDITVRDALGVTARKFVKFPTLYVQFPMKSGFLDMQYPPWAASSLTVLSMQEAIASLAGIYQFYPAASLDAMSNETIVAQFMAGTDFYLSANTWGSGGGVVSLTFHGLNTVVTPAQWIRP